MGVLQGITCGGTEGRQTFEGAQPSVYWDIMPMTTRRPPCARAREHVVNMSPPTLSQIRSNPCSSTHNATVPTNTHLESLCQRPSDRVCPWLQCGCLFTEGLSLILHGTTHLQFFCRTSGSSTRLEAEFQGGFSKLPTQTCL